MILYSASFGDFSYHVDRNMITELVEESYVKALGRKPGVAERNSWNNSLRYMESIGRNAKLPADCGVLVEYALPSTSKRVDFIFTGQDAEEQDNFVIVELKQWSEARKSEIPHLVNTFVAGAHRDVAHPSAQASNYCQFLENINEAIQDNLIVGHACAYLHNFARRNPEPLLDVEYEEYLANAPIFFQRDTEEFEAFLQRFLSRGKGERIKYYIENGRLKPSKKLIDALTGMFDGNDEFVLLDEQQVAYETILYQARKATPVKKVVVVEGGPGTGKSVVALNVFRTLLSDSLNVQFVAPNASFRTALLSKLSRYRVSGRGLVRNLFQGSSSLYKMINNFFDVLIVDEAHRLKGKGTYQYFGENQVEDVIRTSRTSIFFIDDSQQIRPDDIGSTNDIYKMARLYGAEISHVRLAAQFRCSGATGYVNWLTDVLRLEDTANAVGWDKSAFDFKIVDNPHELLRLTATARSRGFSARVLAGYAWPWTSAKEGNPNAEIADVAIPEFDFARPWNTRRTNTVWALDSACEEQIGCVHTSQGLEFDYVGVIFGKEITYNPETDQIVCHYDRYFDKTGKKNLLNQPDVLNRYIRNIYKVLCSRGMRGCYVFICDENLRKYFLSRLMVSKDLRGPLFYESNGDFLEYAVADADENGSNPKD